MNRKTRILTTSIASIFAAVLGGHATAQTNGNWNVNANGDWSTPGNWLAGIADGATATASFDFDINADRTVTLDTGRTIGNLIFRDTAAGTNAWILAGTTTLTLDDGGNKPTITVYPRGNGIIARIDAILAGTNGFELVAGTPGQLGQLGITGNNTFTGSVTIGANTRLRVDHINNGLGAKDALGIDPALAVNFTEVQNGGTLQIGTQAANAANFGTELIKVRGAGVDGAGAITNLNNGQQNALQQVQMTGDTTFGGTARWDIRTGTAGTGRLHQNGFTLTKTGANHVSLVNVTVVGGGDILINQGILGIEGGSGVGGSGTIFINAGGTLNFWNNTTAIAGGVTRQIVANGGAISMGNSNATATIPAPIELRANTIFNQTTDGGTLEQMVFTGVISELGGSFGPIKNSGGQIQLNGNNTYTGALTVNAGTLILNGANPTTAVTTVNAGTLTLGAAGTLGSSIVDVKSGGVFNVSAVVGGHTIPAGGSLFLGRTGVAANDLVGSITLDAGANFEVGTSARNGGMLPVRTATVSGALTFNGGGISYFDLGNALTPGGGVNDLIAVGGSLTLNGTTTIHITPVGGSIAAGDYTLMTYGGVLTGTSSNLALAGLPSTRQAFLLDTTSVPNSVLLNVTGAAASLTWVGDGVANLWDLNATANWDNGGSPDVFKNLDSVLFDHTGDSTVPVSLQGTLVAGTVAVNAPADYVFGGPGNLAAGTISKSGSGTLTITNMGHAYAGGVQINAGAVSVPLLNNAGAAGPLGTAAAIGINGGTLVLSGGSEISTRNLSLGAGGGTVTVTNAAATIGLADTTGAGVLTLNGPGAVGFGRDDAAFTFGTTVAGAGRLQLNPHRVAGSATSHNVDITAGVLNAFTGTVVLGAPASGSWRARFDAGELGGTTGIVVQNGAQFWPVGITVAGATIDISGIGFIEGNGTGIGAIRMEGVTISNSTINVVGAGKIGAHSGIGTLDNVTLRGGELTVNGSNFANDYTIVFTGNADDGVDPLDKIIVAGPGTSANNQTLQVGNGIASGLIGTVPVQLGTGTQPATLRFMQGDDFVMSANITAVGTTTNIHADTLPGLSTGKGLVFDGNTVSATYIGVGTGNIASGLTAKLTLENGAIVNVTNFYLGEQNGRTGIVEHVDADVTVSGQFRVSHWPNNVSIYNMASGTLTLTGVPTQFPFQTTVSETVGVMYLGIDGVGVVNQGIGTTVTTPSVVLDNRGNTTTGVSTYNLNGGTLVLTNAYGIIQRNGVHTMNIDGGTVVANTSTALDLNTLSVAGANPAIFDTNGNTISLYGPIAGTTGITLVGGGTFEVRDRTGGALNTAGGGTGGGTLGAQPVGVDVGTTLLFNRSVADTWTGTISGGGGLTKSGTGTLTLPANHLYTGPTAINGGTLIVGGALSNSSIVTVSGGVLAGTGTVGPVVLNAGGVIAPGATAAPGVIGTITLGGITVNGGSFNADLSATGPSTDLISVVGTASFSGASTFVASISGNLPIGSYPVLTAGTLNVATPPTAVSAGGVSRYLLGIDHTSVANTVLLTVAGGPAGLNWTGAIDGNWNVNTTQNWNNGGSPDVFLNFDNAIFGDGPVNRTIAIAAGVVNTSGVLVANSAGNDYSFNGPGALSGPGGITKNGTGTLMINNANSHSGATVINGGILRLGAGVSPLGTNNAVTVTDGGTLDVNGFNGNAPNTRLNVTIEGAGAPGLASIWNSGAAAVNNPLYSSITLSGDASIGGVNRYDINGGPGGTSFNGGLFTLTKTGPNELWWSPNAGATVGNIIINQGTFGVQSSNNLGDDSGAYLLVVNPAGNLVTFSAVTNNKPIALNGGFLGANNVTGTWTNFVALQGAGVSNRIGIIGGGVGVTLTGQLTGSNGFEKINGGVLTLTNPGNDWQGETRVSGGTIVLQGGGILSPATVLDMNGGTVDMAFSDQTVAGLKGATGTIQGDSILTVDQAINTVFGGNLVGSTGLTKDGAGTLELTGSIGTVGATNVVEGTLRVTGSILGSAITVSGSGVLSGTGSVGLVNVTGGTVAPGTGPGTLTVGTLSLSSTSFLDYELDIAGVVGGPNDLLVATGNLTLDGTLKVTQLGGFSDGIYRLMNYAGTLTDNILDLEPAFLAAWPGSHVDTTTANQINLVVVPEPASSLLLLGGIGTIISLRRRRPCA